jgi:hypothetical protein
MILLSFQVKNTEIRMEKQNISMKNCLNKLHNEFTIRKNVTFRLRINISWIDILKYL